MATILGQILLFLLINYTYTPKPQWLHWEFLVCREYGRGFIVFNLTNNLRIAPLYQKPLVYFWLLCKHWNRRNNQQRPLKAILAKIIGWIGLCVSWGIWNSTRSQSWRFLQIVLQEGTGWQKWICTPESLGWSESVHTLGYLVKAKAVCVEALCMHTCSHLWLTPVILLNYSL